jgi:hypothetical protein
MICSSGDVVSCAMASRQSVFSFRATCPAALHCTHSSASAWRVM